MIPLDRLYWMGGVAALLGVACTLPVWRRVYRRLGLIDYPGPRRVHGEPTPLAGGTAVLTGLTIATAMVLMLSASLRIRVAEHLGMWITLAAGSVLMTMVGMLDDRHALRPAAKFALQLAAALAVAAAGLRVTLFVSHPLFQYAVTVFWILAVINAFNFMDNMNGLCAGLGAIAAAAFAAAAARHAQEPEVLFSLLVCGALLGFLPFNYPRASVFLGDAGSHLIGFCMAVLAILPTFHTETDPRPLAVLKPLLILAVPLLDMAWMVIARTRAGKPFYVGDTNHLSHRLVRLGLGPARAVGLIWLLAAAAAGLALWL